MRISIFLLVFGWTLCNPVLRPDEPRSPREAFRTFWMARVDHRDLDSAAPYYSKKYLEELSGIEPGALERHAEGMLHLYVQAPRATRTTIERIDDTTSSLLVWLPVVGEAMLEERINLIEARVRMVLEEEQWRIDHASYDMLMRHGAGGFDENEALAPLPTGAVLGNPDAPNVMTIQREDGIRSVRFDSVTLYWTAQGFELDLPLFGQNQWQLVQTFRGNRNRTEHRSRLVGSPSDAGLPGLFPENMVRQPAQLNGNFVFTDGPPREGKETFTAQFDLEHPVLKDVRIRGEIAKGRMVELAPRENILVGHSTFGGGAIHPVTDGIIVYDELRKTLSLTVVGPGGQPGGISFAAFSGEPGVYLEPMQRSTPEGQWLQRVAVVKQFDGEGVALELRTMLLAEVPEPPLTPENTGALGEAFAELSTKRLLHRPTPERVILD